MQITGALDVKAGTRALEEAGLPSEKATVLAQGIFLGGVQAAVKALQAGLSDA